MKISLFLIPCMLLAQSVDPSVLLKALGTTGDWATYGGDYSGRRYSSLKQLDTNSVKNLTLAWSTKLNAGSQNRAAGPNLIMGGVGSMETTLTNIKGSILQVDGILYVSIACVNRPGVVGRGHV